MWYSCKRKKETPPGRFVLRLAVSATVNLQQFYKKCPDVPQFRGGISAIRLSSHIHRRGKVQSLLRTLQRLIYSRSEWIWLRTSFYKKKKTLLSKEMSGKCQVIRIASLLTCKKSQKSLAFSFPVWSAHSLLFTLILALLLVTLPPKFTTSPTYILTSSGQLPPSPWKNCWMQMENCSKGLPLLSVQWYQTGG